MKASSVKEAQLGNRGVEEIGAIGIVITRIPTIHSRRLSSDVNQAGIMQEKQFALRIGLIPVN